MWRDGYDLQSGNGQTLGLLQDYPYGNISHGAVDKFITFTPFCPDEPSIVSGNSLTSIVGLLKNEGSQYTLFGGAHCW